MRESERHTVALHKETEAMQHARHEEPVNRFQALELFAKDTRLATTCANKGEIMSEQRLTPDLRHVLQSLLTLCDRVNR